MRLQDLGWLHRAHINLANLYYMAKQYQKARDHLSKAEENGAEVNPKFKQAILKALEKKAPLTLF